MWIVYNRAPSDNGHPLGEEVQVVAINWCKNESDLFNSLEAGKNSAVEVFASLTSYHQVRAKNILSVVFLSDGVV